MGDARYFAPDCACEHEDFVSNDGAESVITKFQGGEVMRNVMTKVAGCMAALALVSTLAVGCSAKKEMQDAQAAAQRADAAAAKAESAAARTEAAAGRVEDAARRAEAAAQKAEAIFMKHMRK